jgi:hypothetical protein
MVEDVSSVSPSLDDVDADAGVRGAPAAPTDGKVGDGTVTGGVGLPPPAVSLGVVTVATGVVTVAVGVATLAFGDVGFGTFGSVTVATGVVTAGAGSFGARRPSHVDFQSASAARSRPSNPLGTASVGAPVGPGALNPFDASEASAVARYSSATAVAYGPP